MEFVKHRVWDDLDFEAFNKWALEKVYLKDEVPEEIKRQAVVIERLMAHCYFEYDFIEIAMLQAIFLLEKALKVRYEEKGNKLKGTDSFQSLINWALKEDLFEETEPTIYHILRDIRNNKVHSINPGTGGMAYLKRVYGIFDHINDLYEDVNLRKARRETYDTLQEQFEKIFSSGFIFNDNGKKWIGFKVIPAFLNNKVAQPVLTLSISQIFDPEFYGSKYGRPNNVSVIQIKNWKVINDEFCAEMETGEFYIRQINDVANKRRFNEWQLNEKIKNNYSLMLFDSSARHGYIESIRDFYRL